MDYLDVLDREVRKYGYDKMCILELGCFNGASSVVLGRIAKYNDGLLTCVDDVFRSGFFHSIQRAGVTHHVMTMKGKTKEILPDLEENIYDVVFIDAGHTYEEVSFDLEQAQRLLRPGGLLIGDDLNSHVDFDKVSMNWLMHNQDVYGSQIEGVPGTIYAGVFLALKEFCDETGFEFEREENLFWGAIE